ncbi:MAG: YCF48-related protein [bacterium]|nr:YCF48-related protein [bacterium]
MKSKATARTRWVLSLFVILALSLALITGCDDDETVVGVVLGEKVSWTTVSDSPTDKVLHDVQFITSSLGWAVGDEGTILKYEDTAWVTLNSGTTFSLRGVYFADAKNGWVVGRNGVHLHTTDGGATWDIDSLVLVCNDNSSPIRRHLNGIHFLSSTNGYAVGNNGHILKWTTDSACANTVIYADTAINDSAKDTIVDSTVDTILYTVGSIDTIAWYPDSVLFDTTFDSTIQWDITTTIFDFTDTIITIDSTVPVSTGSGFFRISNAQSDPKLDLWDVHFTDASNGWVVGKFGTISHTSDGGATWTNQKSATKETLRAVRFISPSTGWVVGHHGMILHTKDGGLNWSRQFDNNGISEHFVGLEFPDASNGWIIATDGSVYRTADGGANWVKDLEGADQGFNALSFIDATTGWVVGYDGEIREAKKQ